MVNSGKPYGLFGYTLDVVTCGAFTVDGMDVGTMLLGIWDSLLTYNQVGI